MMASHIILPPDDDDEHPRDQEEQEEREERRPSEQATAAKATLPFSASCVRISRDSYSNLRALRNASSVSLADAAYVKISEVPVKLWKSPNISISVKDDHTVIFEKRYYEWSQNEHEKNEEKKRIFCKTRPDRGHCF